MTAIATVTDVRRDHYGRPYIVPPDGGKAVPYTRCTTFIDVLADKFKLQQWEKRMVAVGLADRPDLLLSVSAHRDDKEKLNNICDDAKEAGKASASGNIGTALHTLTQILDYGRELPIVPDDAKASLEAYRHTMRDYVPLAIEQFCVLDDLRIGGTPDRILQCPDGVNRIGDVKTGSIDWDQLKIAMQLSVYSRSQAYMPDGRRIPLPDVDQRNGIVIHLPAGQGTCQLYWVDLNRGWQAVQTALDVRNWRKAKGLIVPIDAQMSSRQKA